MENTLYPLKFRPIYKDTIWGGEKLKTILNKKEASSTCGESWELSGVNNNISEVCNGFLEGNNLEELIEIYMGDLIGDAVYDQFGLEFPLLIKFIDANDKLSIQVHPDDELAKERHDSFGKTEMWYVMQAEKDANLIVGFNKNTDKSNYLKHLEEKRLTEILNFETVKEGDVYFIPAGRVHAIGSGILLAEIQQTSDVTYRIYDWDRVDKDGNPREMHTKLAVDAIDYKSYPEYKTNYQSKKNTTTKLVSCPYFETNNILFDTQIEKDYYLIDSFVIYICLDGEFDIQYNENQRERVFKGETVLIPACLNNISLIPLKTTKILEVYIPQ